MPYGPPEKASPNPPRTRRPKLDRHQRTATWRAYCWRVLSRPEGEPITRKPLRFPRRSDDFDGPTDPRFRREADSLLASLDRRRGLTESDLADVAERLRVWDEYPPTGPHGPWQDTICLYFDAPRLRHGGRFFGRKDDDVTKRVAAFLESEPDARSPAVLAHLSDLAKRADDVILAVAPVGEDGLNSVNTNKGSLYVYTSNLFLSSPSS